MIYLLIDTCSWIQLVSKIEVSKQLIQIQSWVKSKEITLLAPEVLKQEWQKHKIEEQDKIAKAVNEHEKRFKLFEIPIGEHSKRIANETLLTQLDIVSELIFTGIPILTKDAAKIRTVDHKTQHKAPFHTKRQSDNDSLLLFSTLDFAKESNILNLFFLSDNHNEFGGAALKKIHEDIQREYQEVNVVYLKKPNELIDTLIKEAGFTATKAEDDLSRINPNYEKIVDSNLPIIEQLHQYLIKRNEGAPFYPPQLLIEDFPFRESPNAWARYYNFTLATNNSKLFDFFQSININESLEITVDLLAPEDRDDQSSKIKEILTLLNGNLIFYVEKLDRDQRKSILLRDDQKCDCVQCLFNRLDFPSVFDKLTPLSSDNENDLLKKAYVNYQVGNFVKASQIFEQTAESARKHDKYTILFIAEYNLTKLIVFLEGYYEANIVKDLVSKTRKIDLNQIAKEASKQNNRKLIDWIRNGEFHRETMMKIQSLNRETRDSYELQVNGGFSSNMIAGNLVNQYGILDTFLNKNHIVYDSFSEFSELTDVFIEAIVASHAIPETQGSKLFSFDDYLLRIFLFYGESEKIQRYFSRYNLKSIHYNVTGGDGDTFLEASFNFLDGYSTTKKGFDTLCETNHSFFWDKYNRMFSNILLLFRYINVGQETESKFISKLVGFLEIEDKIYDRNLSQINYYVAKKEVLFSIEQKLILIKQFLGKRKYHNDHFFELTARILPEHDNNGLQPEFFTKIVDLLFNDSEVGRKEQSPSQIVHFKSKLSISQLDGVKTKIENKLTEHFDYHLYYNSIMYNIIDYTFGNLFETFCNASIPKKDAVSFRSAFRGRTDDRRFDILNMLVNAVFKFSISLSEERIDAIKQVDPYYEWLIDIDNFDYTRFDPRWITEYNTKFYVERFRKSERLRIELDSLLKGSRNHQAMEAYFAIYNPVQQ